MSKRINYKEGDVFLVPLRDSGFARGVVARFNGEGIVLGYFFGPRIAAKSNLRSEEVLHGEDAIFVCRFGDLGLLKKEWVVLENRSDWSKNEWPLPEFLHVDEKANVGFVRRYAENTLQFASERRVPLSSVSRNEFPDDGLFGYGAVEITLTTLLSNEAS